MYTSEQKERDIALWADIGTIGLYRIGAYDVINRLHCYGHFDHVLGTDGDDNRPTTRVRDLSTD